MTIEVISIPDCPHHRPTVERIKAVLLSESLPADVKEILVNNISEASALHFSASPTVRINGQDVDPLFAAPPGLSCRIYENGSGVPSESLLRQAIASARRNEDQP